MVQKASRIPLVSDRVLAHQRMIKDHYGLNRMRTLPRTVSFPSTSTGEFGGNNPSSGNYLPVAGGTMSGPIAFNPPVEGSIKIDISNEINIGPSDNNSQYSGNVLLDILGSASSQLDTISGATFDGQYLVLRGSGLPQIITQRIALSIDNIVGNGVDNIITVTVATGTGSVLATNNRVNITGTTTFDAVGVLITKTGADIFTYDLGSIGSATPDTNGQVLRGNIQTYDGNDIVVTGADSFRAWVLIFDTFISNGVWRVLTSPIGTGGGGLTEPIILTPNVITPQTLPTKTIVNWSNNPNTIILDRAVEFDFSNLPSSGKYEGVLVIIDIDGTGGFASPIWPTSLTNPPVIPTIANRRFSVMLYTIDGGIEVTHATSVGSSTGGGDVSQWANFQAVSDVNVATFDIQNIDRALFISDGSSVTANNVSQILLNSANQFQVNTASTNDFIWSFDNNAALAYDQDVSTNPDQRVLSLLSDSTVIDAVAFMRITHTAINALDTQTIGHYGFYGTDDAGGIGVLEYAAITGEIEDSATGVIQGSLRLEATVSGSPINFLQINDASSGHVDILTQLDMNNKKIINLLDPTVNQDAATKKYVDDNAGIQNQIAQLDSNVTVTDVGTGVVTTAVDGATRFQVQANRVDIEELPLFGLTALNFNKTGPIVLGTVLTQNTTDFTMNFPVDTDVYNINFNAKIGFSVDKLKTRIYSNTPNTSGASLSLFRDDPSPLANDEIADINFDGRNSATTVTTYGSISTNIIDPLSTNETAIMTIKLFDTNQFPPILTLTQGRMTLNKLSSVPTDLTELRLEKEDASPGNGDNIGQIKFRINDSGVATTYALLDAINANTLDGGELGIQVLANSTLLDAIRITGATSANESTMIVDGIITSDLIFREVGSVPIIQPDLGQMAFSVQNGAFTHGVNGSMVIPFTTTEPISDATADTAFGNKNGAIGISRQSALTNAKFWAKADNGWQFVEMNDAF